MRDVRGCHELPKLAFAGRIQTTICLKACTINYSQFRSFYRSIHQTDFLTKGNLSMYCFAASLTTNASDAFFANAISSFVNSLFF